MSSAVVSTPAALGRPFVFDAKAVPEVSLPTEAAEEHPQSRPPQARPPQRVRPSLSGDLASADPRLAQITPASRLAIRPAPEMVSSGVPAIDTLTGGLPRGCLTEICGPASSGRTTLLLAALAAATRRGEFCVVVDASDTLDPHSAAAAGVELDHLLWVRCGEDAPKNSNVKTNGCPISRAPSAREACPELVERVGTGEVRKDSQSAFNFDRTESMENGSMENGSKENVSRQSDHRLEQVLRATDLLLESGGFGLIVLDLADLPSHAARRIPLTTWFRFRRAIEHTPTILLTIEQRPIAGSCSSLLLNLGPQDNQEETMGRKQSEPSREAAAFISPGRKSGVRQEMVSQEIQNESRRDGTISDARSIPQFAGIPHAQLLTGLNITAELIRSRLDRKPARSIAFATKTAWAG
jgi:recombination protein RecA